MIFEIIKIKSADMKKIVFLAILFAAILAGCRKTPGTTDIPSPKDYKGTPTDTGTAIGFANVKIIGAAGGSISSIDNGITVTIPAGAVSADTRFSIQPVTNKAPNGIGISYLLLPEGIHFQKPVTIQFRYNAEDVDGTDPASLLLAYQDSSGIWHGKMNSRADTNTKTITVTSDHFSRWSAFANIYLIVDRPSIDVNESTKLRVRKVTEADLQPLTGERVLDTSWSFDIGVDHYALLGGGSLSTSFTRTCTYTAPSTLPSPNPVTVTAFIKDLDNPSHTMTLKRKIYVHNSFLEIIMDGETNIYPSATIDVYGNSMMSVSGHNTRGNGAVFVITNGTGPGGYSWGVLPYAGSDLQVSIGGVSFTDLYVTCAPDEKIKTTSGTINIATWADVGGFVEGTFGGQVVHVDDCKNYYTKNISGRFKAKRI
jgi:hypothetical protein